MEYCGGGSLQDIYHITGTYLLSILSIFLIPGVAIEVLGSFSARRIFSRVAEGAHVRPPGLVLLLQFQPPV